MAEERGTPGRELKVEYGTTIWVDMSVKDALYKLRDEMSEFSGELWIASETIEYLLLIHKRYEALREQTKAQPKPQQK